ncbi:MAG: hypothetical protein LBE34_05225 [Flavobacteriaceae bacterium]|jgi:hypothetical protein|nr:hypothetical protein [Flavobacteriaceae bacterium]
MQYWCYNPWELEGIEETESYFEINAEGVYCRSITKSKGIFYSSSIDVEHPIFFLPETLFEKEDHKYMTAITKNYFDTLWQCKQTTFQVEWELTKRLFNTGTIVKGFIVCFYPQGVILSVDSLFYVLVDYDVLKVRIGVANMYPRKDVVVEIKGFDEINNWLLGQPQEL